MRPRWIISVGTLGAVLVGLAIAVDITALRTVLALAVCLLLPGWGWARRLRSRDRGDTLALAVVLSMSATVAVSTAMVVTARWSTLGGLIALMIIGGSGFVPTARFAARIAEAGLLRPATVGAAVDHEWVDWYRRRSVQNTDEQQRAEEEWVDWYAGARRRAAEERARARALQREADEQWADWYRTAHPDRAARRI